MTCENILVNTPWAGKTVKELIGQRKWPKKRNHGNHAFDRRTRPLQCRVDLDTRQEVEAFAKREGIWLAEALRQLVEWGLETANDKCAGS